MAVYLFTLHTYRSWMPDHAQGFVQPRRGILPTDPEMARHYEQRARGAAVRLDRAMCEAVVATVRQACERFGWRCHAVTAVWSHIHVLISWTGFRDPLKVRGLLKRTLTRALNEQAGCKKQWFARRGSRKRVRDRVHFEHLMTRYLPDHRRYGGVFWSDREGDVARR